MLRKATVALAGLALVLAAAWAANLIDLRRGLLADSVEVFGAAPSRPSHVDRPSPGTLAAALRPALAEYDLHTGALLAEADRSVLSDVACGLRPPSELPAHLRNALIALEPQLDALLVAAHAESAALDPEQHPFLAPVDGPSPSAFHTAAKHVAIRIWLAPPGAKGALLPSCLDALALGRDAAVSGGLIGRMLRAGIADALAPACAAAIAELPPDAAGEAARRLRLIRDAVPPFSEMLREEGVTVQLLTYGGELSEEQRARLPALARAFALDGSMSPSGGVARLRALAAWRSYRAMLADGVERSRLPPPARDAALAGLWREYPFAAWMLQVDGQDETYASYARRDDAATAQLDALVVAALSLAQRGRVGRWPASLEELVAGGLRGDEAGRLEGLRITPGREGALELTLDVPGHDLGDRRTIVLEVGARQR